MKYNKVNLVYFSATNTTKTVLESLSQGLNIPEIVSYDITKGQEKEITFATDEIVIFGMPVYSGRIPQISIEHLNKFKGCNTPAIIVCVYGNRDYDDALLELNNVIVANNFRVVSAGAFIGQHSIFPPTGNGRPDTTDKEDAISFGQDSIKLLENIVDISSIATIELKGNIPYKEIKSIPLQPKGSSKCDKCGKCVRNCPTNAISIDNPRKTDETLCISCARCIYVCPQQARSFGGIIYKLASKKFNKAYVERKPNEQYFCV